VYSFWLKQASENHFTMRRSYAPSQVKHRASLGVSSNRTVARKSNNNDNKSDEITIQRLPLFGFLSIPNDLKKQYKMPSGCVISAENIALRKTKTLGQRRMPLVVPGGYVAPLTRPNMEDNLAADEEESSSKGPEFPPHEPVVLWRDPGDDSNVVQVIPQLACRLRPHQREGVQFLFECVMGLRGFEGEGCILADDMGLGKTLMSLTLLWTLLNQGMTKGKSAVQKAIVVCPTSLVGNWENELRKWIGDHCPTFAVKSDPQKMIRNFIGHRSKGILIISYETQRRYCDMFTANSGKGLGGYSSCCELLICDEAHKLKNADSGLSKSLTQLPARKRILLSGTPMQNELTEFFNMVNFCNPNVLGSLAHFRKKYENPILRAREIDASSRHIEKAELLQKELSTTVNEFILKRGNIINAQHLPPKLVQFVCCKLTPLQEQLYECVLNSKESRHLRDGKQTNTLNSLRHMLSICSHPDLILSSHRQKHAADNDSAEDEVLEALNALMLDYNASTAPKSALKPIAPAAKGGGGGGGGGRADRAAMRKIKMSNGFGGMSSARSGFDPERSGKFLVLFRLMSTLRNTSSDRIVVVSNTTQTLDLVESMCNDNNWPQLRLDGSIAAQKRTKLVDTFNDPTTNSFAFLLSSKAGGCGINLIGGNRLVMMDPDWNPASDKQAAARIWREGQQKRCYIYRLMSTCTIEEKIIQRQLSKEGLQSIVDNTDQVNSFSSNELKSLFQRDNVLDTRSNTHDTLRCKRCKCVTQIATSSHKNGNNGLLRAHADVCVAYLTKMIERIELLVSVNMAAKVEAQGELERSSTLGGLRSDATYSLDVQRLKQELEPEDMSLVPYKTVPELSKRIRIVMVGVDQDLKDEFGVQNVTLCNEFVTSWTELVPVLQDISKQFKREMNRGASNKDPKALHDAHDKENEQNGVLCSGDRIASSDDNNGGNVSDGEDDGDGDEYVEQEGCPEEEDFNRWSHHSSVRTCYGDESLQKAMSMGDNDDHGDNTISFVFGLEVNWDLLQEKIARNAERDEERRVQVEADLLALNRERAETRRRASGGDDGGDTGVGVADGDGDGDGGRGSGGKGKKKERGKRKRRSSAFDEIADEHLCIDVDGSSGDEERGGADGTELEVNDKNEKQRGNTKKKKKNHSGEGKEQNAAGEEEESDDFLEEQAPRMRKHKVISSEKNAHMKVVMIDDSDNDSDGDFAVEQNGSSSVGTAKQHPQEVRRRRAVCSDSEEEEEVEEGKKEGHSDVRGALPSVEATGVGADTEEIDVDRMEESEGGESEGEETAGYNARAMGGEGITAERGEDEEPPAAALAWTCESCTFCNTYPARLCDVCG
jgi:DNA repair and recombination protein RAD54 and RAD54-like protein